MYKQGLATDDNQGLQITHRSKFIAKSPTCNIKYLCKIHYLYNNSENGKKKTLHISVDFRRTTNILVGIQGDHCFALDFW